MNNPISKLSDISHNHRYSDGQQVVALLLSTVLLLLILISSITIFYFAVVSLVTISLWTLPFLFFIVIYIAYRYATKEPS